MKGTAPRLVFAVYDAVVRQGGAKGANETAIKRNSSKQPSSGSSKQQAASKQSASVSLDVLVAAARAAAVLFFLCGFGGLAVGRWLKLREREQGEGAEPRPNVTHLAVVLDCMHACRALSRVLHLCFSHTDGPSGSTGLHVWHFGTDPQKPSQPDAAACSTETAEKEKSKLKNSANRPFFPFFLVASPSSGPYMASPDEPIVHSDPPIVPAGSNTETPHQSLIFSSAPLADPSVDPGVLLVFRFSKSTSQLTLPGSRINTSF